jgi:ankyrin repeat protein
MVNGFHPNVRLIDNRILFASLIAAVVILGIAGTALERRAHRPISADEFARAITTKRVWLIDLFLRQHRDPNARTTQGRPLILAAALEKDWGTVQRLLKAGASVDLGDENGVKPLMAAAMNGKIDILNQLVGRVTDVAAADRAGKTALHYAVESGNQNAIKVLLPLMPNFAKPCADGRDLLAMAFDTGNWKVIEPVLDRYPPRPQWSGQARGALATALREGNNSRIRLLLAKHSVPPTPPDSNVPLLAHAIASNDISLFSTLLACGADPNTVLPPKCDKEFLASLPRNSFRSYVADDKGITVLMLAAGLGPGKYVITDKERNHWSTIYKVEMPYFMRLSCLDFGMHAGAVPNYPASHGCIRLPSEAARKLFAEIPVGTVVAVQ